MNVWVKNCLNAWNVCTVEMSLEAIFFFLPKFRLFSLNSRGNHCSIFRTIFSNDDAWVIDDFLFALQWIPKREEEEEREGEGKGGGVYLQMRNEIEKQFEKPVLIFRSVNLSDFISRANFKIFSMIYANFFFFWR